MYYICSSHGFHGAAIALHQDVERHSAVAPQGQAAPRRGPARRGAARVLGAAVHEIADRRQLGSRPVRYWAAEAGPGTFTPNSEVDQVLWLTPERARDRLTQPRDRVLVDALLASLHQA